MNRMGIRTFMTVLLGAILIVGCAHRHVIDSIQTDGEVTEARVTLGSDVAKDGDKLIVYKRVCGRRLRIGTPSSVPHCNDTKVGEAQVTRVDGGQVVAKPDGDLKFEKGMVVERK